MKLGILKEGKIPPDKRVPLTPQQCKTLLNLYPKLKIEVESSPIRCFTDEDYRRQGVTVKDDISTCDFFLGVKEVPVDLLIEGKSYMFFSHTIKKQEHNRKLLQAVLEKHIRLIDYELLTDKKGMRLIGFGKFAGLVGAYNSFLTYGKRYGFYDLKPAHECADKAEMMKELKRVQLPAIKIAVTGNGRVANGVLEVMEELAVRRLSVDEYLNNQYNEVCYVQLSPAEYNLHKGMADFDLFHFFKHPKEYKGNFKRFCKHTDMLISAAFWDPQAPVLFTMTDMQQDDFKIKVIADITCDIGGSIPSTIRACRIGDPIYDFNPFTMTEEPVFSDERNVTMMTVDNLPNELPKDASREFGAHLMNRILDFVIKSDREGVIERATIAEDGDLTERFKYLEGFAAQQKHHHT
ncbi:NAD(P)-dependent oxidoreductase [Carboxylicivirga linearis]|uniref:Saccharopine dehydrogenase [NAD(+), L-lysine-forming] n=1 Tax=Carboxylicivirga linearis TaxID=1628157 RepID=A0ABS5JXD0_9BACT|nr:NAD(P)-dependent oxidoreductase [Carboxylicivirga linearis]MBS2099484.1 alanine dehydrogenase [Carboxylicivirga linearis]